MHRSIWLAATAALALAGCNASRAEEPGPSASRSYPVGAFDQLEVAGPYQVTVTTGGQPSVRATGGANLLDKTVVEVENGTLKIHPRKTDKGWTWSSSNRDAVRIAITVPALRSAEAAGSGSIAIDKVSGERFSGAIAGSGGLKLPDVQVGELRLEIAGSGNAEGRGRATVARYEIAGSGNILAGGIAADRLQAEIAGTGNIEGQARTAADVDIAGAGNVTVTGGAKCTVSKAGSGDVHCS
jgi:hypothetical protein